MNEEAAKKWVAALRSGNYQQVRSIMRKGEGFCALGVLCDAIDPDGWKRDGFGQWRHRGTGTAPCLALAKELAFKGVIGGIGMYHPEADGIPIATMNDSQAKSFAEIADAIERHWETM